MFIAAVRSTRKHLDLSSRLSVASVLEARRLTALLPTSSSLCYEHCPLVPSRRRHGLLNTGAPPLYQDYVLGYIEHGGGSWGGTRGLELGSSYVSKANTFLDPQIGSYPLVFVYPVPCPLLYKPTPIYCFPGMRNIGSG